MGAILDAVLDGTTADGIEGVEVVARAALSTSAAEVLAADGYVLGTPANLGYMSGALKHFFDTIYEPCLDKTVSRPFGIYVHGATDTTGAIESIDRVTTGLRWRLVAEPLSLVGPVTENELEAAWNLGATVTATVAGV